MARTLYILYNANGTAFGKLSYGYKKLTSSASKPVCSACEMTHGGLRLDENGAWKEAKAQIEKDGGMEVKQLHRDELGAEIKSFVEQTGEPYPLVLSGDAEKDLKVVMSKDELGSCGGDAQKFVGKLREKGILEVPAGTEPSL